jgi:hypothetical protein
MPILEVLAMLLAFRLIRPARGIRLAADRSAARVPAAPAAPGVAGLPGTVDVAGVAGAPAARVVALALFVALAVAGRAPAQDEWLPGPYEPVPRDALGTRLIDVPTPFPAGARRLQVLFTHRFLLPVNQGDAHNFWGLDSGADVGIGLTGGITRNLDLSVFRSSFQENYEVAGKFLVFEQARRVPASVALRVGADLLQRPGVADRNRPFVQLLLARRFAPGCNLLVSPSWVRDTPQLHNAFNAPVGVTVALPARTLLEAEVIAATHRLRGSHTAWHAALSKPVGGHIFQLVAGNSRATTVDQYLGGDSAAGFKTGDVRLGFNLVRDFSF